MTLSDCPLATTKNRFSFPQSYQNNSERENIAHIPKQPSEP